MSAGDGDSTSLGSEAAALLSDPPGYIRSRVALFVVSSVLSVLTFVVSTGIDLWESVRSTFARAGGALTGDVGAIWSTAAGLLALPIQLSGDLAASAGLFGPLVAAGAFALTAAISAAVVWGLYRVVRFI